MIFNVMDYGATGNGATDDTQAIQAAVDAARAAGGGTVYIPAGIYIVTGGEEASDGAIRLYDNIAVQGDGMGQTTVKLQDGSDKNITGIFRTPTGVENHDVTVRGLTIDGNRDNTSGKVDGWFNGVKPDQPGTDTRITLDGVEIKNCSAYGFDPHERTTGLAILNCVSHGNGLDGFTLDFQIDARVENCTAYDNDRHGFNIVTSSRDVELINIISHDNGSNGVMVQRGSEDRPVPDDILIQGGHIYDNANDGVQVNKADHVTIDGVEIEGSGERGVRIIGSVGSVIENSHIHNNSREKNLAFEEIRIESFDDTNGVSGRIYPTTGTMIVNNTITDDGAVRGSFSVREVPDADFTTVSNNVIYGTGEDRPLLSGAHSTFAQNTLNVPPTADPDAPRILYAPLLGQSNAELMKTVAPDGGSGLSHIESGLLQQTDFDRVVTMVNMAVGGSTVNGDRSANKNPSLVWWYPEQNRPGEALLLAVDQMKHQIAALRAQGQVTPMVIWAQGEAEANELGTSKSDGGRRLAEEKFISSTRLVFNYIQNHVGHDVQFYLVETGNFNQAGATAFGYPQSTIDKEHLGLTYVRDAQIKMAEAYSDVHLAANYADLPMRADVPPSTPGWDSSWVSDAWHLAPSSQEAAGDRIANFIALNMGYTQVLDDPGPYPRANLADIAIHAGPGKAIAGNAKNNIIAGTAGNDNITGGGGDDVIVAGGGQDTISGGTGKDTFYYHPSDLQNPGATRDRILDFETGPGGDVVDVSALLKAAAYKGTNPIADGYIQITQQGSDTLVSFDRDGMAGTAHAAVAIAVLANTSAASFTVADNLVTQFPGGNALTIAAQQPPRASDDDFSTVLGQQFQGNVLNDNGNGLDASPDGLALSTAAATLQSLKGGTVVIASDGSFTYQPAVGFVGTDSFTYRLLDSKGGKDTGTVFVSVAPPAGAFVGTAANDTLTGGSRNDVILGQAGNDVLSGGSGNDTLYAGTGNDTLNGNAGTDTLHALSGDNTLNGNDDNDTLFAGTGNDTLIGGNGNDMLVASSGNVVMTGGKGADTFAFVKMPAGADTISDFLAVNGDKIDISKVIFFNPQLHAIANFVQGVRQGADLMLRIDADGALNGASFVDLALLRGVQSFDAQTLIASGNLIAESQDNAANRDPVAKSDAFTGLQDLQIKGNVLNDNGGGADNDPDGHPLSVSPWSGMTAIGGTVSVLSDGSFIYTPKAGFAGNDSFSYTLLDGHGGSAHATVALGVSGGFNGTSGNDIITAGSRDDVIRGQGGDDTISGGSGNDTVFGDAGNDTLNGNSGNDALHAVSGNDVLHGNDGNDTLRGGSGNDLLFGDNGDDLLVAGAGGATMTGGGGADTFSFSSLSGFDTVTDFRSSIGDKIDLRDVLEFEAGFDISEFVRTEKQGAGLVLSVDRDGGANGHQFTNLALLQGVSALDLDDMLTNGALIA